MTGSNDGHTNLATTLLPHQRELVEAVVGPDAAKRLVLQAAAGSGKTTAFVEIARRLLENRSDSRVLFVMSRSVVQQQIVNRLRAISVQALALDRYKFRELLDGPAGEMWPIGTVIV